MTIETDSNGKSVMVFSDTKKEAELLQLLVQALHQQGFRFGSMSVNNRVQFITLPLVKKP